VKLGILVESEEGLDWAPWRRTFEAVEQLGFDSLWLSDHLESPWAVERHGLDPFVALAVAAAETRRIRLGTLVSPITFRPPVILARMAEAVDALAPGAAALGRRAIARRRRAGAAADEQAAGVGRIGTHAFRLRAAAHATARSSVPSTKVWPVGFSAPADGSHLLGRSRAYRSVSPDSEHDLMGA
jgi:alkanesulfonate monooxygenase SsuD/methylene tetrahydromethanopterin reductase-like flavin-dependent oxidoreductase (luciferase family)